MPVCVSNSATREQQEFPPNETGYPLMKPGRAATRGPPGGAPQRIAAMSITSADGRPASAPRGVAVPSSSEMVCSVPPASA